MYQFISFSCIESPQRNIRKRQKWTTDFKIQKFVLLEKSVKGNKSRIYIYKYKLIYGIEMVQKLDSDKRDDPFEKQEEE